jgi:uncharacterized Fe-S cluster-containing radical SAM superfamily enzyme
MEIQHVLQLEGTVPVGGQAFKVLERGRNIIFIFIFIVSGFRFILSFRFL